MSNELIHEVEESLKQERLHALWKEYGPYLIAGVILAILLTGLISGWRTWQHKVNTANTAVLIEAMSAGDVPAALSRIEPVLRPGQRAMAYMSHAGILLNEDRHEEALAVLKQAAADKSLPAPYGDLARLQAVRLEWGLNREADPRTLLASLQPLIANTGSTWHLHARYQAALVLGENLGDYRTAHTHLAAIRKSGDVPDTLMQRATALDALYKLKVQATGTEGVESAAPEEEPEG